MADPYLAVSLDAVNHAADLGRASGLTEEAAGWGLVRMWAHAFRSKVDMVTAAQVSGFFGGDVARVAVALIAFGFLEARGADFRVKGADRYLRLHEARRKGGLAAAKHLVPGARQRRNSLGSSPEAAQRQPEVQPCTSQAVSGLFHRSPITDDSPSENPRAADGPPPLRLEEQRPGRTRKPSRQQVLYSALVAHRAEVLGPDALPDESWSVQRQNEALGGPILECESGLLLAALQRFLESEFAGRCNPPGPLGVFVKQWSRWVSDAMRSNQVGAQ